MKLYQLLFCGVLLGSQVQAATIANMLFKSDSAGSGVFIFEVDGELKQLFCNQFYPNATTLPYQANVASLADLTGTTLFNLGDPDALFKYQRVAILDLMALLDPSIAVNAVKANRHIVDGTGALPPGAQDLFDFVMAADASKYNLSGFRIYTNPITQEVGGYDGGGGVDIPVEDTPEPAAFVLLGSGLLGIGIFRRRRSS